MSYDFKDAATQNVSQTMLIGVAGPTGSGKTETMIRIGLGIVGANGKLAVIDTENKRALNKKNRYRFDHLDMQPPYSPENYEGAIKAAIAAGYKAIVVDSFSHEWDGDGGLSEDADAILEKLSKGDAAKAERMTALAWKEPKKRHKRLMAFLRKCDVPIIFGLRAEPKIKFVKEKFTRNDGSTGEKTNIIDAGWLPIAEKMFGFDMLIYALMMAENPGIPVHLKKLEPEFEPFFPAGKQVTEKSGQLLAQWAAGSTTTKGAAGRGAHSENAQYITGEQVKKLEDDCFNGSVPVANLKKAANVEKLDDILATDYDRALAWLNAAIAKRKEAA